MKRSFLLALFSLWLLLHGQTKSLTPSACTISFDAGWLFLKDSIAAAWQPGFPDTGWRRLDLPHDWSIEDLPGQRPDEVSGPFSKASAGKVSTGFTVGGTGWYRKHFVLSRTMRSKRISVQFDGVYMHAEVWINGHFLGDHVYGYTPFVFDLTGWLNPAGRDNVLAVRVVNRGQNSRWYSGSGIYRHVWLSVADVVNIAPWGVHVTTPDVSAGAATARVETSIRNESNFSRTVLLQTMLVAPDGTVQLRRDTPVVVRPSSTTPVLQDIGISAPRLWSVDTPSMYKVITRIVSAAKAIDSVSTPFGIREIRVSAGEGLQINGRRVKLKGGCIHHDNGPLGSVAIDRAEERKIELLKANGFNAIRTSHNPPSPQLLNACDRLGMLVVDEAFDMWERPKNPDDYHLYFNEWWSRDLSAWVTRDRNHPSVIFWSIGNEISERGDPEGIVIEQRLVDAVKRLDSSRPVTEAICAFWEHGPRPWDSTAQAFSLLDVGGYNYEWRQYEPDHRKYPQRIMMGTESFPKEALDNWRQVVQHTYVIGDFVWTAMDYMGEASIGHTVYDRKDEPLLDWPWFNAWCGDLDLIGNKKPQSLYRDVVWGRSRIEMAVHQPVPDLARETVSKWGWPEELPVWSWTGAEGKPLQVRVFSLAPAVRLYLNGRLIGEQHIDDSAKAAAVFMVPYAPGTLKAVVVEDGREADSVVLHTTSAAVRIRLTADRSRIRADRNDLSYVSAELVDANGRVVTDADTVIRFQVEGDGELAAAGNGNPVDLSSFQQGKKSTFRGRALAIVRPGQLPGKITLRASAAGLEGAEVSIFTQ